MKKILIVLSVLFLLIEVANADFFTIRQFIYGAFDIPCSCVGKGIKWH